MFNLRRTAAALASCGAALAIAGCHFAPRGGMAERCAQVMIFADPGADIEITKREATATSLTAIVAHVEGEQTNIPPPAPGSRHLAVECKFDNSVLTGFRWTAGPN